MWNWLVRDWQWPAAALFSSMFLFAVAPLIASSAGLALALVYLQLPAYMLHQWEEHQGDRFRLYINRTIGGGREALTPAATFWINSLGVWAIDLIAFYAAWFYSPVAGLVAGYLAVVNAVPHIGMTIKRREYNPGVITAVLLFLPLGGWCVAVVGADASWSAHLIAVGVAVGVHVAIIVHVARRLTRLNHKSSEFRPSNSAQPT
ncbi:HXXEE domain-containing protein [Bremerella cremea]|uniref:HXXEE domain-containing protein n=1 Tax=Blastopirellula marina TaxID=124 RepID=A0A2S8G6X3_9BACT|nr:MULTISPECIES: HXXEE domain-containing protein [Pirellulaceae]PQO39894.1 HXXEE domain-containing protein [Blastopirellula marina]RCS51360.1 HXXEE domain-containing protein [Bremerella cremea]